MISNKKSNIILTQFPSQIKVFYFSISNIFTLSLVFYSWKMIDSCRFLVIIPYCVFWSLLFIMKLENFVLLLLKIFFFNFTFFFLSLCYFNNMWFHILKPNILDICIFFFASFTILFHSENLFQFFKFFFIIYFIYLIDRDFLSVVHSPNTCNCWGIEQGKIRTLELNSGLLNQWKELEPSSSTH